MRSRLAAIVMATAMSVTFAAVSVVSGTRPESAGMQEPGGPGDRVAMPTGLVGLQIVLGLRDDEPTRWEGDVSLSAGEIVGLVVTQPAARGEARGSHFRVTTRKATPAKKQQAKKQAKKAARPGPMVPVTMLVNLLAPADATVTIKTDRGAFSASLSDLRRGQRQTFLDGQAAVERMDPSVQLTGGTEDEDFPAAAKSADGSIWLAYTSYTSERPVLLGGIKPEDFDSMLVPTKNGDRIYLRRYDGKTWDAPIAVTSGGLDVWRPVVAVDGRGDLVVIWAQQVDHNWDLYRRTYTPGKGDEAGRWSEVVRLTDDPGTDSEAVATTDAKGTVWVAWQAWRSENYDILAMPIADGARPRSISSGPANDWSPTIAADRKGNVFVAWDTYERGNYDVRLRSTADNAKTIEVASTPRFQARPSIVCDGSGRVWIAYEEGDPNWGKDYSSETPAKVPVTQRGNPLYLFRTIRVKCLDTDGTLKQPPGSIADALPAGSPRGLSCPRLAVDDSIGLWLLFRRNPNPNGAGEAWDSFATHHDGRGWTTARHLLHSSNLIDNRPALAPIGGGLMAIHSTDNRFSTASRSQDDLHSTWIQPDSKNNPLPTLEAIAEAAEGPDEPVHPNEAADKARLRAHRIEVGGQTLRLARGEFHRHTEFSSHRDQDGLLEDTWRYALDAADLDWMGNGDHMNGFNHEYMWWLIQKGMDLHDHGRRFVAAYTYERSAVYPNGHRNVMMPRRGIRPLPFGDLQGTEDKGTPDTKNLYDCLKHFGGFCSSHTSATNMGTDWRDNDGEVEPVVEIYQGHRHNYEFLGAPRSPTEATQIGGYQPKGFISNALAKGYRLGFQSSSDHVSTHWSYGIVLTEDNSHQAIIDAFKKRHSYAATDNILLDVRSGDHLMGDVFETDRAPTLTIKAVGTAPIKAVHVIRDGKYAMTIEPGKESAELTYTDDNAKPGETHYYYVRVEQTDTNLAWASPIWITFKK